MKPRAICTLVFAVIITANHFHCVSHAAMNAGSICAAMQRLVLGDNSLEPTTFPGCHNESGCICRGATLMVLAEAPSPDVGMQAALAMVDEAASQVSVLSLRQAPGTRHHDPFAARCAITGRALRARIGSLLV